MPAARYWRAVGLQSVGGGALELSALHLCLGGARVDAAATLTSTFAPASGSLAALQDEDTATTARWLDVSASGFALVWDFGAGNAQDVGAMRLGAGALYAEWLETLTLQYSSDGVAWVTLGYVAGCLLWPGVSTLQGVPSDGDEHFRAVSLLLRMAGESGSTTFTDSSATPKAVTAYDNAKITTAQIDPFGSANGVAYFDGSGDYCTVSSSGFPSGSEDVTVECFLKPEATGGTRVFASQSSAGFNFELLHNGNLGLYLYGPATYRAGGNVPNGSWSHVAFTKQGDIFRLFVGGILVSTTTQAMSFAGSVSAIGLSFTGMNMPYKGWMSNFRVTKGVARYTANFTPSTLPFAVGAVGAVAAPPLLRAPMPERARIAASAPVPPHSTLSAARLLTARDMEFAGSGTASAAGTIYGSTAIKGSPNAPVRAKVSLLRARDLLLVQQTWSDPTTGAYAFHGLDPFEKYTTLAEYPTGDRRAVAADQLTPDIEEARAP